MAGLSPAQLDAMEKKPVAAAPKTGGLTAADLDRMASGHTSSPAVTENPFVHGVKQVGTGIGNALDAQRWAAARLLTGKTDTGEQRTAERTGAGLQGVYEGLGRIPVVGHALQGASDVLQDTLTDPLTYETAGAGPVLKALGITAKVAPKIGEAVKAVSDTPLGSLLHDTLNWGGQVTRERGAGTTNEVRGALNRGSTTGTKTEQQYRRLSQGILDGLTDEEKMSTRRALNGEQIGPLVPKVDSAVKNLRRLTELDYKQRYRTKLMEELNTLPTGHPRAAGGEANPHLGLSHNEATGAEAEMGEAAREPHVLTDATKAELRTALATGKRPTGFLGDVYDSLHRITGEQMPYRQNYAPTVHEAKPASEVGAAAKTVSPANARDVRAIQRENVPTTEPGQLGAGFEALASNAGRIAQKRVIHESLGELVNDPAIKSLISDTIKATGEKRTNVQKVGDAWLKVIGYPRAATVSLTPRHAVNILDLASNTVPPQEFPGYMKNVTALAAKLVKADEKQYANLVRGTSSVSQNFAEHKPFFQNVPVLKHWTALNNKITWAVDTAAKVEYEKILKKMHPEMNDLEAGGTASKRLVDYEHVSPAVKALRYVAPFGTFRGSIPGAVLGGIARNPARAALLNRATGGTMYGGKPDKGQHGVTLYNPTADIGRGLDAPQDFLRGTLGAPVQGAATLGLEAATGNPGASIRTIGQELKDLPGQIMRGQFSKMGTPGKVSPYAKAVALRTAHYLNYGNPIDLRWLVDQAAAGLPEAQAAVEQIGASQFKAPTGSGMERFGREALRQAGGVGIR